MTRCDGCGAELSSAYAALICAEQHEDEDRRLGRLSAYDRGYD